MAYPRVIERLCIYYKILICYGYITGQLSALTGWLDFIKTFCSFSVIFFENFNIVSVCKLPTHARTTFLVIEVTCIKPEAYQHISRLLIGQIKTPSIVPNIEREFRRF